MPFTNFPNFLPPVDAILTSKWGAYRTNSNIFDLPLPSTSSVTVHSRGYKYVKFMQSLPVENVRDPAMLTGLSVDEASNQIGASGSCDE